MEVMAEHSLTPHIRFGMRHLLVAVTSCAVALALLSQANAPLLQLGACCVLSFWAGVAMLVTGDAFTSIESPVTHGAGAVLMLLGYMVALLSALLGFVALEGILLYIALGHIWD
jgi:hypothetical protein